MSVKLMSETEILRFVQDRLDTRAWWLIAVAEIGAARMLNKIVQHHYIGDQAGLLDVVMIPWVTPNVPVLTLAIALKSCMSPAQLAATTGSPVPLDSSHDVVIFDSTPLSVVWWIANKFRWQPV